MHRSTFVPSQHGTRTDDWRIDWAAVVIGLVTFALALALVLVLGAIARATDPMLKAPTGVSQDGTLPPCVTEDSTGCYWDAETMGNKRGHDVVSLPDTEGRDQ